MCRLQGQSAGKNKHVWQLAGVLAHMADNTSAFPFALIHKSGCVCCRDKALATISADGILLVLASMIDNMPYVLAEASVMRIPPLIYDVGGVTEMIDPKLHADIICGTPKVC